MGYHRSFFGIGSITAIPSGANATPVDLAIVRGATVEFKSTEKPLKGNLMAAVDSATTDISIGGKIQTADFYAASVALVIPGTSTVAATSTPRKKMALHSAAIPSTPFTITVTNSAAWTTDLGVVNLTTGKTMTRVASSPAAGQYSVALGVYTFASAEGTVAIRYIYTDATTGSTLTATNQAVGSTTGYGLYLADPAGGTKENVLYFPSVKFSNLSLAMKSDDWSESSFDFTAYADATGNLFYAYGDE